YIGNKTRLLGFIRRVLRARGIEPGSAVDPFTGTASVASELKRLGFRVVASDIMEYAYVFGRAYVEVAAEPSFDGLAPEIGSAAKGLDDVVAYLNRIPPEPGFIHEHYTPAGGEGARHGRMYFTPENAARIDAIRATLHRWRTTGAIDDDAYHLLLAALIEAADRVANTAGVYASFIKSWQPNALAPLELRTPRLVEGNGCHALRRDALELVAELEPFDLLYLDPPYNARQYPGYYHIPELIAIGWFDEVPRLRGKTGLVPDADKRSDWARRSRCEEVFERLVATAPWRRIVMSYNAEGIIPETTIERVLRTYGRSRTYRRYAMRYRRYRSDADGENRRYRGDVVVEYLYCVDR
ncbi:MAG TPA: DNA adenine methylase, partial [Longimicrobiales bacterium]|nr:DNA adenine methylase [Longimicrobiales bacterium]